MTATESAQADGQWTAGCRLRRALYWSMMGRLVPSASCGKSLPTAEKDFHMSRESKKKSTVKAAAAARPALISHHHLLPRGRRSR